MKYFNVSEGGESACVVGGKTNDEVLKSLATALSEHFCGAPVEIPTIDFFADDKAIEAIVIVSAEPSVLDEYHLKISETWLYTVNT